MNKPTFLLLSLLAFPLHAQQAGVPKFSDSYARTPAELAAIPATGGAGGSGNPKVQVVTLLGDPSQPGPYSQLLRVARTHPSRRTTMPATGWERCCRAPGISPTAAISTSPP